MLTRVELNDIASLFSEGIEPEPALAPAARRRRRLGILRESVPAGLRRFSMVAANALRRRRLVGLPAILKMAFGRRPEGEASLPDPRRAAADIDGFVGLAPDLSPATMIEAYSRGLAPTACFGPIAWQCPPTRFVAAPAMLAEKAAEGLAGRARTFRVTFDRDVDSILVASATRSDCASLVPERLGAAFAELFDAGYAHTFEVRDRGGRIVAGGYGVAVGRVFVLERVFSGGPDSAMAGLARLAQSLRDWDFALVECGAGAAPFCAEAFMAVSREAYVATLSEHMSGERVGRWPSDGARGIREARAA
jgi:leucyl/phenylalanyl-tRNA---protein transferase